MNHSYYVFNNVLILKSIITDHNRGIKMGGDGCLS